METLSGKRLIIVGAGPIGLEAALYARMLNMETIGLERDQVGGNIAKWKHVRLFSPFRMNRTPLGQDRILERNFTLPDDDAYLTGQEYLEHYIQPLAQDPMLSGVIRAGETVKAIGRQRIFKSDHIGTGERENYPFRVLSQNPRGDETFYSADFVIDTSGSYGNHNWIGDGGIPALGETENESRIAYDLQDIVTDKRDQYLGTSTLLVGAGHSAATTVAAFQQLIQENAQTRLFWLTRSGRDVPVTEVPDDPLVERARITGLANEMVSHPNVQWIQDAVINSLSYDSAASRFIVEFASTDGSRQIFADNIIGNVGYGPDNSIYRELQIHECYASRGPMSLAAALLGESSANCLDQPELGAAVLKNPEPGFYIAGVKSYGKNSNFLLQAGHTQIRDIFQLISGDKQLDLYHSPIERAASSA